MKTRESILQEINQIENRHRNDKDGGYSFIDDVERFFKALSTKEKKILIDVLIEIVDKEDASLWGVALESIVRFQDENVGKYLFQLTKNKKRNCELLDQIFLTLVRLGYKDSSKEIVKHIENGLRSNRSSVIPILAALCHINLFDYIRLSSRFLIESINRNPELVESYSSASLGRIIKEDDKILSDLLKSIAGEDKIAAKRISNIFEDYLDQPWIKNEFGVDHVSLLKRQISQI